MANWVLTVAAAAFIGGIAAAVTPKGKSRDLVGFVAGLMTIAVMLTATGKIDFSAYTQYLDEFELEISEPTANFQTNSDSALNSVIKEKTAAYILDKTGTEVDEVRLEQSAETEYPIPVEVWLSAVYDADISAVIESDLGIAPENQHWKDR